jgi:hypothetical protein
MFKRNPIEAKLDMQIDALLHLMEQENGYTDDYKSMANQLTTLMELRQKHTISKDAWLTVGANLAGIIVVLNHERAHIIASKAFGLVKKIV